MSSIKDKMYEYEAVPPAGAWDAIAAGLDNDQVADTYPARLYDLEATPPAGTWAKIVQALEPEQAAEPAPRRILPFLRYAAAAIFIGAIAFTVLKLTTGKTGGKENASISSTSIPAAAAGAAASPDKDAVKENTNDDAILERSKKMLAKLDRPSRNRVRKIASITAATYVEPGESFSAPEFAYEDELPDMADRYIMLMTPDGSFIRMSKKWSSLLCCVSGEEQDADCKDQLKKWQEKIAASPITPSPGNFLDILGLVNSLDEEL